MYNGCEEHEQFVHDCDACNHAREVVGCRLVADLHRKRVSVSCISLAYYLQRGYVKIVEVHRVVQYTHTRVLAEFMDNLLEMRKSATTEAEKQLIKLIMNSLIGYTMMDKAEHVNIEVDVCCPLSAEELT